jgi:hypothetical protein
MRAKLAAALIALAAFPAVADAHRLDLDFRGQAIVPSGTAFDGTTVGGLSSITYDTRHGGVYYAISDDASVFQPVRYYTVALDIRDGKLTDGDVTFKDVTTMLDPDGNPYARNSLDPEGLALTRNRELIFTSEGMRNPVAIDPFVRRYELDGTFLRELPVPEDFLATPDPTKGVRHNLGFESAGVIGHDLFVGTENALLQDGPAATVTTGSPARILRYDLKRERLERQWSYTTDPVAEPPVPATQFSVNGLVELLPLDDDRLLAMERSFSVGAPDTGNTIKLFEVTLRGTTAQKRLLLNLDTLGIPLDNVEGMTFGPPLRHGRRSLVLVSDNNFAATQFTQFLLFALDD